MSQYKKIGIAFLCLITTSILFAQNNKKPLKVAVFAPVYLDSSFEGMNYKLGGANLPKSVLHNFKCILYLKT